VATPAHQGLRAPRERFHHIASTHGRKLYSKRGRHVRGTVIPGEMIQGTMMASHRSHRAAIVAPIAPRRRNGLILYLGQRDISPTPRFVISRPRWPRTAYSSDGDQSFQAIGFQVIAITRTPLGAQQRRPHRHRPRAVDNRRCFQHRRGWRATLDGRVRTRAARTDFPKYPVTMLTMRERQCVLVTLRTGISQKDWRTRRSSASGSCRSDKSSFA
jgi:hypothetical protein